MKLPVVSCSQMRAIEEAAFAAGATAEGLMEQVGRRVAEAVMQNMDLPGLAVVYYGKGHNGGDALVAARYLAEAYWHIELHPQDPDDSKLAELTGRMLAAVHSAQKRLPNRWGRESLAQPEVILDGLLGIGAKGPLREDIRALTREINARRAAGNGRVFAVDLPTGLDADTGQADRDCVEADYTVTAGYAKRGLLADGAAAWVGRICVAALKEFEPHAPDLAAGETATPESLRGLLARRNFESHKTQYGRVGIVAGSLGFTGAAVLCATGALRGGAGLVTVYAPEDAHPLIAAKAPAEVMVKPVKSYEEVLEEKVDVLAVGPGIGKGREGAILQLIEYSEAPMVLDADGLNIVAEHDTGLLAHCAAPRLLTPHPGEMARLYPEARDFSRLETVTRFTERFASARHPITLLLKGSRTIIHEEGKPVSYNTTGNPGMGTGGMGDILTGVCAALIGQHLGPYDAARVGAWICGRAAEIAVRTRSAESLAALDTADCLGLAFGQLRDGCL